ncbi:MAG TPA: chemotaxis response regulator protein-glutamate methylesterase [Polyangiaceae bacterium]|nr:chemotaxis response regulator protein-glutamate methylesterase [Polyangiaceae bacterium]
MNPIQVLIVDDSAVVRQVLTETLSHDPGIRVLGAVADPLFAMERMKKQWPDVIVTDVEMPRMDGVTFVRKIMSERPTPIVVCSSLTEKGAETTMQVLALGAVHVVTKPKLGVKTFLTDAADNLTQAIKAAARSKVQRLRPASLPAPAHTKLTADAVLSAAESAAMVRTTERIVAIGTSTGGTQALEVVLRALPRVSPGIVVVQHMPEKFTAAFAARLNGLSALEVREARNNDRVLPGLVLIAPGGKHMLLRRNGAQYHVEVRDGPAVNRHRPSVDVLFRSTAQAAGRNACGIIMTGMGDDGARGLREMHDAGARTIAQDEDSCVVYGMPREAVKLGGVDDVLPLHRIATAIQNLSG